MLKIFRGPAKDQEHLDFITENETYTEKENQNLCDILIDQILEMESFVKLEQAFRQLPLATLKKHVGEEP